MPSFTLRYAAPLLEGASSVRPAVGGGDFALRLRLRCTRCREEQAKVSVLEDAFNGDETKTAIPDSKGVASLVQKCSACSATFTVDITSRADEVQAFSLAMQEGGGGGGGGAKAAAGAFLASLECRGCEPSAFEAGAGWVVEGAGGTLFEGVDLGRDDFAEYDEKADCSVVVGAATGTFSPGGKR